MSTNIREAILRAADHLEAHPEQYDIFRTNVGSNSGFICGGPPSEWRGCALAWIDKMASGKGSAESASRIMNLKVGEEYFSDGFGDFRDRMNEFADYFAWTRNASECSRALRLYANKYHPADSAPRLDPAFVSWRDALALEHGYSTGVQA